MPKTSSDASKAAKMSDTNEDKLMVSGSKNSIDTNDSNMDNRIDAPKLAKTDKRILFTQFDYQRNKIALLKVVRELVHFSNP